MSLNLPCQNLISLSCKRDSCNNKFSQKEKSSSHSKEIKQTCKESSPLVKPSREPLDHQSLPLPELSPLPHSQTHLTRVSRLLLSTLVKNTTSTSCPLWLTLVSVSESFDAYLFICLLYENSHLCLRCHRATSLLHPYPFGECRQKL